jgi:simple sugar transport system ATP-binding protein
MDEPTSVLTPQAVLKLFETLRRLAQESVSILYISHKLDEIRALCDTATVLRGGKVSGAVHPRDESNDSLARLMVGGELAECRLEPREPGKARLSIVDFSMKTEDPFGTELKHISLDVREGEIVGIAGISGNGQKELLSALSGEAIHSHTGEIRLGELNATTLRPAERRELGLTFVPEERLGRGAVPSMTLAQNALLTGAGAGMVRHGVVRENSARAFAREVIERFKVKGGNELSPAESLSGGNLQKFIVGRETQLQPSLMIVAQPTWGVDIGATQLIHQALIDLRDSGVALLIVSEELEELFSICDRIAVIAQGKLSATYPASELTFESVGLLMTGATNA